MKKGDGAMIYEARQSPRLNYLLAGACAALSILGFAAAGVIPTESTRVGGSYPLVGWAIVGACFAAAFVFVRRAMGGGVQARIDGHGVYAPAFSAEPVPWDRIRSLLPMRVGIQRIVRFELDDPASYAPANPIKRAAGALDSGMGFGHFGINTTFYDRGQDELLAAVRHYRPDLVAGSKRL
jgi:hypothetical protein